MNTWIELIDGPMSSEMLQLEILCGQLTKYWPFVIVLTVPILLGVMGLLTALDCIFLEDSDQQWSYKRTTTREQRPESSRGSFSQSATRLLRKDTNAIA